LEMPACEPGTQKERGKECSRAEKETSRARHPSAPTERGFDASRTVAEYAGMVGRRPDAVRRDIERKVRREGDNWIADLPLGVRAHKPLAAGRWAIVVPRNLVGE
jgi:hypothetical protein